MSSEQIDRCHELERATGGVVRWGGDWSRPDAMHWEIAPGQTLADCERALDAMRARRNMPADVPTSAVQVLRRGSRGPAVERPQHVLNGWYPAVNLTEDGAFGPATEAAPPGWALLDESPAPAAKAPSRR